MLAGLANADELEESGLIRILVLAQPVHFGPEPIHRCPAGLVSVIGQVAVNVIHFGAPTPGLHRTAAGHPDGGMRMLHRARPDVHVALLIESAVEGEYFGRGPGADDQVVRLVIAFAKLAGIGAVSVAGVHRGADREAGNESPAGDAVDHGEFFGHAGRRIIKRQ